MVIISTEEFERLRLDVLAFTVKLTKEDFEACSAQDKDALCAIYREIISDQLGQRLYKDSVAVVGEVLHAELPENYLQRLCSNFAKVALYHSQNTH